MNSPLKKKAVFLDRDGTIIEDRIYLSSEDEIKLIDGAVDGLLLLKEAGFLLIIVTNQSGVARGYFDIETVHRVHAKLNEMLLEQGVEIDGIYFCPHYPSGVVPEYSIVCGCRKPDIKMAFKAVADLNASLKLSYVVGDKDSDLRFGRGFGAAGVVGVAGAYDKIDQRAAQPDFYAKNLFEAAKWIIHHDAQQNPGDLGGK